METQEPTVMLEVTFDIEQLSQRLDWKFVPQSGTNKAAGAGSGVVSFNINDTIGLLVIGKSKKKNLSVLKILDAHMITRPLLHTRAADPEHAGEYPAPSPFFQPEVGAPETKTGLTLPTGACVSYGNGEATGEPNEMRWKAVQAYTCHSNGRWDTSFIMTVEIQSLNGSETEIQYRVFTFDPETQVGTGGGPGACC